MSINIRLGTRKDIPAIYSLVCELASFEKALDQVKIDEEYYVKEWNQGTFQFLVCENQNQVIGVCIYYLTFSTWRGRMIYLEDFVVSEQYRNQGLGQRLFDAFLAQAKKENATMVKWQVLDWNTPAVKFYEKNNAIIEKQWWNGKIIF